MSTLLLNTLTGKTSAGSIVVTGEGGSTTTNLQQGVAKSWIMFDGTGTIAITDSFNHSTIADEGTGIYRVNFSNNMGNATYSIQSHDYSYGNGWSDTFTTSGYDIKRRNESGSYLDVAAIWSNTLGDLG